MRQEATLAAQQAVPEEQARYLQAHKRRLDICNQLEKKREAAAALAAFEKYKRDDEAEEVKRDFLLRRRDINDEAQPRHVHR